MLSGQAIHRLLGRAFAPAILLACLLPVSAGASVLPPKATGSLSPLLSELANPLVAAQSPLGQARSLGLPSTGPGSLLRQGDRVLVRVRFDHGAIAGRDEVRAAGARVLGADRRYQTATVAVAPGDLEPLASIATVAAVTPIRTPMLFASCEGGSVISEGVGQLNADEARKEFGVDGTGVTVGVLSDSYDEATGAATDAEEDIQSEDLPGFENACLGQKTPVNVIEEFKSPEATDEGRGMLQIVHDMAPGATLSFATAFEGEEGFAKNIEKLATAGAKVIVDDVAYFEEPFFQDGPVAAAINKVTGTKGVTYLSAAGNDNLFDAEGNEIASWEAPEYRDSGGCPPDIVSLGEEFHPTHCLDFNPGAATDRSYGIKVEAGEILSIDLQWAEPWEGVESDLDAFLLNANGQTIAGSFEPNEVNGRPLEIVQWFNNSGSTKTVQLVVNRYSGPGARLKFILLQNGGGVAGVEYPRSGGGDVVGPSVFGHAGAGSAIAVGAVPYNDSSEPEFYSSRGPVVHLFEQVKGGSTPADPLPSEEVLSKPDVAATDCGGTTFFAFFSGGEWHFCGTSAAAPHAAGAVALMLDAEPLATNTLLRESLVGTASSVGAFDSCAVGGGLVETVAAVKAARKEKTPTKPAACELPDASGEVFVAPGDWGSETPPPAPTTSAPTPPAPTPVAPQTRIAKHPSKVVRTRGSRARVVFRFAADQGGVVFLCKVDGAPFRTCAARIVRRLPPGRHVIRAKARSSSGLVDPTPAVFRFRIERI